MEQGHRILQNFYFSGMKKVKKKKKVEEQISDQHQSLSDTYLFTLVYCWGGFCLFLPLVYRDYTGNFLMHKFSCWDSQ